MKIDLLARNLMTMSKIIFGIFILINFGCVTKSLNKSNVTNITSIAPPKNFESPIDNLQKLQLRAVRLKPKAKIKYQSKEWFQYVSSTQNHIDSFYEQEQLEMQLSENKNIELIKNKSYTFELDSFCIDPQKSSPGSNAALMPGAYPDEVQKWLPTFLSKYAQVGLNQQEAQILIWAIVTDVKFDELTNENKLKLLKIFPDAAIRFGNRRLENLAEDTLRKIFPEVSDTIENFKFIRDQFLKFQNDYKSLEKIMVLPPKENIQSPPSWFKIKNTGLLIRMEAFGYKKVRIDLFYPEEVRYPQAIGYLNDFLKYLGVPTEGQRIAISPNSVPRKEPTKSCEDYQDFSADSCHEMSSEDREKILSMSNPENFPNTRYEAPKSPDTPIEQQTDCSHFVQEIYHRAGFDFPYAPTKDMECLSIFEMDDMDSAEPGDLVIYKGHVGILDKDGKIISATVGGAKERSKLPVDDPNFKSSIQKYNVDTFNNIKGVLKWKCPK